MGASDWTDGEWCGPVSVRELRSGWRFLLRKRSSRGSLSPRQSLPLLLPYGCSHELSLDGSPFPFRSRAHAKVDLRFSIDGVSICGTTVEIIFQLSYDNPWIFVRDRLHDYRTRYIPRLRTFPIWMFIARMDNKECYCFPVTGPLDVQLTVQLRQNSGEADANFCR